MSENDYTWQMMEDVDADTGEIIEPDPEMGTVNTEDLPRMARILRSLHAKKKHYEDYMRSEMERVAALSQQQIDKVDTQIDRIIQISSGMMKSAEMDKVHYPGLGKFRFGTTRVSVNDEAYQAMTEDEQAEIQNSLLDLFTVKTVTTVKPDKKAIKPFLEAGTQVPGFKLNDKQEKFEFIPED